jgi:hypothetical protein
MRAQLLFPTETGHAFDCRCRWCMLDLAPAQSCDRCGLRGVHECVPDSVEVAGMRLDGDDT